MKLKVLIMFMITVVIIALDSVYAQITMYSHDTVITIELLTIPLSLFLLTLIKNLKAAQCQT